jgi:N-acetyl-beta-hexosaminidase
MKIKFEGDWQGFEQGIRLLSAKLGLELTADGLPIHVEQGTDHIEAQLRNGRGLIRFIEPVQFFRALGLFLEAAQNSGEFDLIETPQFSTVGVTVDMSRNAVLTVASVQTLLRKMAVMGLNTLMLYTEDTYTIDSEPYFGYMRGRYSPEELTACADYAAAFGIEIVPCIQTLAHLEQFLKWTSPERDLVDTKGVLLVGSDSTYALIEKMIKAITTPLRSKRIHIGMDEAHGVGRGRYLDLNGQHNRFEIISNHLRRVLEITNRHGLEPMIWSDMYFRVA